MKPIPEIVREHILKTQGRMPETDSEIDDYLDLINYGKEYVKALQIRDLVGVRYMKKLGFKTPQEIKNNPPFKK